METAWEKCVQSRLWGNKGLQWKEEKKEQEWKKFSSGVEKWWSEQWKLRNTIVLLFKINRQENSYTLDIYVSISWLFFVGNGVSLRLLFFDWSKRRLTLEQRTLKTVITYFIKLKKKFWFLKKDLFVLCTSCF